MITTSDFPIPLADRLPSGVKDCPIVEATMEIRFVTSELWRNMPGLLLPQIRERYATQKDLPLAGIPEEIRKQHADFVWQPLVEFQSKEFVIEFGPRVMSLTTMANDYPGWKSFSSEIEWLVKNLERAGFIDEGERLSLRYVGFFKENLFPKLRLNTEIEGRPLSSSELSISTVLHKDPFTIRLQIANSIIAAEGNRPKPGSILDIEAWLGPTDFDLFTDGMQGFDEAHTFLKQMFFGLLKPDFLSTLSPRYS